MHYDQSKLNISIWKAIIRQYNSYILCTGIEMTYMNRQCVVN